MKIIPGFSGAPRRLTSCAVHLCRPEAWAGVPGASFFISMRFCGSRRDSFECGAFKESICLCLCAHVGEEPERRPRAARSAAKRRREYAPRTWLCTQGVGGPITHFFRESYYALDFRSTLFQILMLSSYYNSVKLGQLPQTLVIIFGNYLQQASAFC